MGGSWPRPTLLSLRPDTLFSKDLHRSTIPAWPTIVILTLLFLNRTTGRYQPIGRMTALAVAASTIGAATVALPEILSGDSSLQAAGLALSVLAALLTGTHHAVIVPTGDAAAPTITSRGLEPSTYQARAFTATWLPATSQIICSPLLLIPALLTGEPFSVNTALAAMLFGFLTSGVPDPLFRLGTAVSTTTDTGTILYATPLLALFSVHLHQGSSPHSPHLTVVGATLIIGSTIAIAASTARSKPAS